MSWYHTAGNCPSYIIFSSVCYRRNPAKLPFMGEKTADLTAQIEALMTKNGFHKELLPCGRDPIALSFAEKQFYGIELLDASGERSLYLNEPCNLAVAVGGEDLISIRSILSGKAIGEGFKIAAGAEELLDRTFDFAYSDQLGYLTGDRTFCGSGCEIICALYLPGLRAKQQFERLRAALLRIGCRLSPLLSCETQASDIYLLTKKVPFLCSEEQAITEFELLLDHTIKEEEAARRILFEKSGTLLLDRAWRAYGALLFARQITEEELYSLLSDIRLALALTEEKKDLPPLNFSELTSLMAEGSDAALLANGRADCTSREQGTLCRAEYIRSYLANRTRIEKSDS